MLFVGFQLDLHICKYIVIGEQYMCPKKLW